ncbi:MAG: dTDP-4-dehydrorhamnose 3,5-epimerase [Woeseiaceae bacterium]|nr:dTDP-4-dehydrorhamnose 3,5-epimerase [Woeseiaceae bacterium]
MKFIPTRLVEVVLVEPDIHADDRGFLAETWRSDLFEAANIDARFVLDLHCRSVKGTLRGLHYQAHRTQGKLVRVLSGEIYDVAVDVRGSSPTVGQWVAETLSADNRRALWIPPGFAHGYLVLSETADIQYKLTDYHAPDHERTIRWDDEELAIAWPMDERHECTVSDKDRAGQSFREADYCA